MNKCITSFLLIILSTQFNCKGKKKNADNAKNVVETTFAPKNYNFISPTKIWEMPISLNEISGINLLNDSTLLCNEDENGSLYFFNLLTGKVDKQIKFGKKGDYEDLAIVGDTIFVLRSDGNIFRLSNLNAKAEEFNSGLQAQNNTEGLCYDDATNSLFIVCKDEQGLLLGSKSQKQVYQVRLPIEKNEAKQLIAFDAKDCRPSAVAVHPISHNIFILSAKAQKIVEINRNGEVLMTEELDAKLFAQPEGMCFAKDGTLYISNEAAGGVANVMMFKLQ